MCSCSWTNIRLIKTFFDHCGCKQFSVSEKRIRAALSTESDRYEAGTVSIDGRSVHFVRCIDAACELRMALQRHAYAGKLIQHNSDELRVTVIGDKGGEYTKLVLSIWDVVDNQSPHNAVFIGMYEGDEEHAIISDVFGPKLSIHGTVEHSAIATDRYSDNCSPSAFTAVPT